MSRKFLSNKTWTILLLLVAPIGSGTEMLGHTTPDMVEARLAVHKWANALLNRDLETMASVLAPDMTTAEGQTRDEYVKGLRQGMHKVTHIWLRFAYFNRVAEDIRVRPVYIYRSRGVTKPGLTLTLRKKGEKWLIHHIESERRPELPAALSVDLPEQHQLQLLQVHLRDATSGRPLAARVRVVDSSDSYWPPQGHQKRISTGWREDVGGDVVVEDKTYDYVPADFILPLRDGDYRLEVLRGLEYEPYQSKFTVQGTNPNTLEVKLQRWSNLQQAGWYSGDTHVHFVSPHGALLEAKVEDLNVVNILASKWDELITNVEHFTGAPDRISEPDRIVYVNEECRHDYLGHTVLLNLKNLVYPLTWGGPDEGVVGGLDYPPMAKQADKTHAQGGFVGWAHFPGPHGELAVDVALGKVDSVDLMTWGDPFAPRNGRPPGAKVWYGFLNCGFKLPATAGTDKMANSQVTGIPRTYVHVRGSFSYESWLEGIRAGRTFVTTGPLLRFKAAGKNLGETITASRGEEIEFEVSVQSWIPVDQIEIVQGGEVAAAWDNKAESRELILRGRVTVGSSSWIAARARGRQLPYQMGIPLMAHTSPIYLDVEAEPRTSPQDAAFFLKWVEEALVWARQKAKIPDPLQRQEVIRLFEKARELYEEMIS